MSIDAETTQLRKDLVRLENELQDCLAELNLINTTQKWLEEQMTRLQFEVTNRLQFEVKGKRKFQEIDLSQPTFANIVQVCSPKHLNPPAVNISMAWERQQLFKLELLMIQARDNFQRVLERYHSTNNASVLLHQQAQGLRNLFLSRCKIQSPVARPPAAGVAKIPPVITLDQNPVHQQPKNMVVSSVTSLSNNPVPSTSKANLT